MSGVKISALPAVTSALTTDIFPVVQAGVTSQETLAQVLTLFQASATNFTGLTGVLQAPTFVNDSSANHILKFSYQGTPVNYITLANAATASSPGFTTDDSGDTNVNLQLTAKGTGSIVAASRSGTSPFTIVNLTNGFNASFSVASLSTSRAYTLPDASGTIALTSGVLTWAEVTSATQTIAVNKGYSTNRGGGVVYTLPAVSAVGDMFAIQGYVGAWSITQGAGQQIRVGSSSSTVGVGGSVASTAASDSITFVCVVANTTWANLGAPQTSGLTIV